MKRNLLAAALLGAIGVIFLFGQNTKDQPEAQRFLGRWTVRYVAEERQALGSTIKRQPSSRSAKTTNAASPDTLEITLKDGQLIYDGFTAQVFSGTNDQISYRYAIGSKTSEWGVATSILYASTEGKLYGVRSRVFWGRTTNDPAPMVSAS